MSHPLMGYHPYRSNLLTLKCILIQESHQKVHIYDGSWTSGVVVSFTSGCSSITFNRWSSSRKSLIDMVLYTSSSCTWLYNMVFSVNGFIDRKVSFNSPINYVFYYNYFLKSFSLLNTILQMSYMNLAMEWFWNDFILI